MYLVSLLVALVTSISFSQNIKRQDTRLLPSYMSDAKISQSTADLYRSYKIYLYLFENHKDYFYTNAIGQYLKVSRELASVDRLKQICDILAKNKKYADVSHYQCALELFTIGEYSDVKKHLTSITNKSKSYLPSQILLASTYLAEEDHERCLKSLSTKKQGSFEASGLTDLYFLTRARCQAKGKAYSDAIVSYQSVPAASKYYFDALSELSWVFFKVRDVELVRNSVKIIQASYKKDKIEISPEYASIGQYFFSKYLLSYLDLVVYGSDQKQKFSPLYQEVDEYLKKDFISKKDIEALLKEIESITSYNDFKEKSLNFKKVAYHLTQWLPYEAILKIESDIRLYVALNKELTRFSDKVYTRHVTAEKALSVLRTNTEKSIKSDIQTMYDTSLRIISGLKLKIKLGEVDLKNLSKTDGLKSLDEATSIYKEKENSLSQRLGLEI